MSREKGSRERESLGDPVKVLSPSKGVGGVRKGGVTKATPRDIYAIPPPSRRDKPNADVLREAKRYVESHDDIYGDQHEFPTMPGLAYHLGLPADVLNKWRRQDDPPSREFDEVCKLLEVKLHHILLHEGAQGNYGSIAGLALQHIFGYAKNQTLSGREDGEPLRVVVTPEVAQAKYKDFM